MLGFLTGLGTWKIALMVSVTTLAMGFYAGQRWEKADRYKDAQAYIVALDKAHKQSIENIGSAWQAEADKARIEVEAWGLQNQVDENLIRELLAGQVTIRRDFDELENTIQITTDVGTCKFSLDAVRLLNASSATANRDRAAGDKPADSSEDEAGSGNE